MDGLLTVVCFLFLEPANVAYVKYMKDILFRTHSMRPDKQAQLTGVRDTLPGSGPRNSSTLLHSLVEDAFSIYTSDGPYDGTAVTTLWVRRIKRRKLLLHPLFLPEALLAVFLSLRRPTVSFAA